jgi:predicted nucleic acid-binding protein
MLVALDTNVLAYAEGINGRLKQELALALIEKLADESTLLPVQVLGELFNVLTRKAGRSRIEARDAVQRWGDAFPLIETSSSVQLLAMDLSVDHGLGIWDAIALSAAADARCRLLVSEDLQDGFTWGGVTVANPFAATPHRLLQAMLNAPT